MTPNNPTAAAPLNDSELARLEVLLSDLPSPLQAMDLSALDGYLCGVLLQARPAPLQRWWPAVVDAPQGRVPDTPALRELQHLVLRRHAELDQAIAQRNWFDPWIFAEPVADDGEPTDTLAAEPEDEGDAGPAEVQAVLPWMAGFAAAMEQFPELMDSDEAELVEPLALLFMHFDPNDLEDADALLAMMETLEPPQDLAEAVQDIVRAVMLIADVSRPRPVQRKPASAAGRSGAARPRSAGPASPRRSARNPRSPR